MYSSLYIHFILLLLMNSHSQSTLTTTTISGIESDHLVLLEFKEKITQDPFQVMNSWNNSVHFCQWVGVSCNPSSKRVVTLNLSSHKLVGSMPPSIGNLTFLTGINLIGNYFNGEIPQQVGLLQQLQFLNLTGNSFTGEIPANLSHCSDLLVLDLYYNMIGSIPDQLSSLTKLVYLDLEGNNLTGRIPPWIGNFSYLSKLSLGRNNLEGSVPIEFGQLRNLGFFEVSQNKLSGTIPPSVYNISSIFLFSVSSNHLHGQLPSDIGLTFPNLKVFYGGGNNFTGNIPVSLSNISGLQELDFEINHLSGPIPIILGKLQELTVLQLGRNQLGLGGNNDLNILTSLVNCTNLRTLSLSNNLLGGKLPESIGNLSTLEKFVIGRNYIHGGIPIGIQNLVNLTILGLDHNYLRGTIPVGIGRLQKLEKLYLNHNKLSSLIPSSIGNLSKLILLHMGMNNLQGIIPISLGNCLQLQQLDVSYNNLTGSIPESVLRIPALTIYLDLSHNSLSGSLPLQVSSLANLAELLISDNKLSGEIPSELGKCVSLIYLYLDANSFEGTIPQSLSALGSLEELDISSNKLTGQIPEYFGRLHFLYKLNLSFNDFQGKVPQQGVFLNTSAFSVTGNSKICGGIPSLGLPVCVIPSVPASKKNRKFVLFKLIIPMVAFVVLCLIMIISYLIITHTRSRKKPTFESSSNDQCLRISYTELLKATDGFSSANLIGVGSYGSVYKGVLRDDSIERFVAVKVLNLLKKGASKSFLAECNSLKNVRHRNLIKILTVCSSVDSRGNEFKALVFEFMANGSLENWLHPDQEIALKVQPRHFNFLQRLNAAIDVASALDYLHHQCETPIVHRDLKPTNILLDDDMTAHVGDFGLAKFLSTTISTSFGQNPNSSSSDAIKGSIGYVAPEYGMGGEASKEGDVYSFGIVLLEMFTGKRPTEEMFTGDLNLHCFSKLVMISEGRTLQMIDERLFIDIQEHINRDGIRAGKLMECLNLVLKIGVACSVESAGERMCMRDVVMELCVIREVFLRLGIHEGKRVRGDLVGEGAS